MSFKFKVTGSFYSVVAEMIEIEMKAQEEGISGKVHIEKDALLANKPYIIVTCDDVQKGQRLYKRVQDEVPRFSRIYPRITVK